jgi:hypothetical protein
MLFQGHKGGVKYTNTCFFFKHSDIPKGHIPTFVNFLCYFKQHKTYPHRVGIPVGGDRVEYHGEVATNMVNLPVTKSIINSMISTKVALPHRMVTIYG